ncbi:uncharacterized protein BDV14DRAFT_168439 [Aspergillus stella-maris]|uniref:uncharacterized protein n=1 Tax=Aspergillus stella-maris TaxID=1810926 RepID=UPI003CCCFCB0
MGFGRSGRLHDYWAFMRNTVRFALFGDNCFAGLASLCCAIVLVFRTEIHEHLF